MCCAIGKCNAVLVFAVIVLLGLVVYILIETFNPTKNDAFTQMRNKKDLTLCIFAFDRYMYVEKLVKSLKEAIRLYKTRYTDANVSVYVFQDGSVNFVSGEEIGKEEDICKVYTLLKSTLPDAKIYKSKRNIGIGLNQWRGYNMMFDKLRMRDVVFLEDDNVVSPYYMFYMRKSLDQFRGMSDVAIVSSGFVTRKDGTSDSVFKGDLGHDHAWSYGMWRDRYLRIRDKYKAYIRLIKGIDYSHKHKIKHKILDLYKSWGVKKPTVVSQDAARTSTLITSGYTKMIVPYFRRTIPIGKEGTHFNEQKWKFDSSTYDIVHEHDLTDKELQVRS